MNTDKPILELMDEFLANHDIRESSLRKYRDNLLFTINWLTRNADIKNLQRSDIIRYKQYLVRSERTTTSVDFYLTVLRKFFNYLEETGAGDNITAGIHSPKRYRGYRKKYLEPDQVNRLLSLIDTSTVKGLRDYAIINLMVRTGMRCVEVARADISDMRSVNKQWVIHIQGKGQWEKERILGLTDKVVDPILKYLGSIQSKDNTKKDLPVAEDTPMFLNHSPVSSNTRISTTTISRLVKKYLRATGINSGKITAHSLRHTTAISCLKNGASLYEVQRLLGHKSSDTTQIYLSAIEEEKFMEYTAVRRLDNVFEKKQKKQGKNDKK